MLILLILIALLAAAAFVAALESRELHQAMRPDWQDVAVTPRRSLMDDTLSGHLPVYKHVRNAAVMRRLGRYDDATHHEDLAQVAALARRLELEAVRWHRDHPTVRAIRRVQGLA
jgi:hypothetical protein